MKRTLTISAIMLLVFVGSCTKMEEQEKKVFPVKTITVVPGSISSSITVMGTVDSPTHTWIIATAEGSVSGLSVKEGSFVTQGQVVCYIMPLDAQNMIGQSRLEYARAKTAMERADESSKEEAQKAFEEADVMLKSAYKLYRPVPAVSPVNGTVLSKTIENGSNVSLKQNLVEVADLGRLIVRSAVTEELVSKIRVGQSVKLRLQSNVDVPLIGRITAINPGINFQSRTAGVEIGIPRVKSLRPGMTCAVEFVTEKRDGAVVAPIESVLLDYQGNKTVFLVKDGKARLVPVSTGIESNTGIEITKGVNFGDELVVMGQDNLKNGAEVKMIEEKPDTKKAPSGKKTK